MTQNQLPYLIRLSQRLQEGSRKLNGERRLRHLNFLLSFQQSDGGFCGREGESDLYYTSFAVRSLMMLNELTAERIEHVSRYLVTQRDETMTPTDHLNWISSALAVQLAGGVDLLGEHTHEDAWLKERFQEFSTLQKNDGGYGRTIEGSLGSTYQTFMIVLIYNLFDQVIPNSTQILNFLENQQRDDGGFVEMSVVKRSGANPTAAAAATLGILNAMDDVYIEDITGYYSDVRSADGGFSANTRIPFSDVLSTFTALLTLVDLAMASQELKESCRLFVEQKLELTQGGFRAAEWDEASDVEYCFYGLGVLALTDDQE